MATKVTWYCNTDYTGETEDGTETYPFKSPHRAMNGYTGNKKLTDANTRLIIDWKGAAALTSARTVNVKLYGHVYSSSLT